MSADGDGRQRRVEYVADENGFRAKVASNEVGTKSENSADVEVLASPPTREQLVYQQAVQEQTVAVQPQRVVSQQVVAYPQRTASVQYVQQPQVGYGYYQAAAYPQGAAYSQRTTGVQYVQQPQVGYGYYPGYGYGSQYSYGVAGSPYGYGYNNLGYANGYYSSYVPSTYYKSVGYTVQQSNDDRAHLGPYQALSAPKVSKSAESSWVATKSETAELAQTYWAHPITSSWRSAQLKPRSPNRRPEDYSLICLYHAFLAQE